MDDLLLLQVMTSLGGNYGTKSTIACTYVHKDCFFRSLRFDFGRRKFPFYIPHSEVSVVNRRLFENL